MPFFPHLQYTLLLLILPPKFLNVVTLLPFTIHFATINTNNPVQNIAVSVAFTIHFATINTNELSYEERDAEEFTIHFATINTCLHIFDNQRLYYLQYTLLLLIRRRYNRLRKSRKHLQYTLLLLILRKFQKMIFLLINLQYTLLLLIPSSIIFLVPVSVLFTIHFATINTPVKPIFKRVAIAFTIHFATINTIRIYPYYSCR